MYCLVAVKSPFNRSILTYVQGENSVEVGSIVKVPLGKQVVDGCILKKNLEYHDLPDQIEKNKLREILKIVDAGFFITSSELDLFQWLSKYYHYNLGQLIFDVIPKILKRPRILTEIVGKDKELPFELTTSQKEVIGMIEDKRGKGFSKWLLHGITGSGKTAVYLSVIKNVLKEGKSVLFLLPEINLTPQFLKNFEEHVAANIYSYNSSISASDKYGLWKHLHNDDGPKVIIGVRSSIFLPIQNLGLIIVDEEHDSSFKQDDRCSYNARDVAIKRARSLGITVILGSATPSLETFYNFQKDKSYLSLTERVGHGRLPIIELVNDTERTEFNEYWPLNENTIGQIRKAVDKNEQVLIFVNRIGFANYLQCGACGYQFHCPNCSVNLRYHKQKDELSCSFCDYKDRAPQICPDCQNMKLLPKGFGTEKLQDMLSTIFSDRVIKRFDRDEITTFKKLEERLEEFHRGEIDILVGTQMLSKGHNFERVNLVVVAGIDSQLNFPDFRAAERVFQLLTQVAGRSGRFGDQSKVLVHTLNPDNSVFRMVQNHAIEEFYSSEIEIREICKSPPFSKLAMVYIISRFQNETIKAAAELSDSMKAVREKYFGDVEIIGPRPGLVEKRVNKFTWAIMVRSQNINQLHNLLSTVSQSLKFHHSIKIKVDIDPAIFM